MSEPWKNSKDLIPREVIAYLVCLDCRHAYTETLYDRPGPCPSCDSTTNRDTLKIQTTKDHHGAAMFNEAFQTSKSSIHQIAVNRLVKNKKLHVFWWNGQPIIPLTPAEVEIAQQSNLRLSASATLRRAAKNERGTCYEDRDNGRIVCFCSKESSPYCQTRMRWRLICKDEIVVKHKPFEDPRNGRPSW